MIIGTKDGTVKAWTFKRLPDGQQWIGSAIQETRGAPSQPRPDMPGRRIPTKIKLGEPSTEEAEEMRAAKKEEAGRKTYLKKKILSSTDTRKDARDAEELMQVWH